MQCSKEIIVRLFYNTSSSFQLLFLFFYLTSIFLSKLLFFISSIPFLTRNDDEYEYATFSEEEQEQEEEEEDNEVISNRYYYDESTTKDDLLAHINREGQEDLFVLQTSSRSSRQNSVVFDEEIVHDYLESPKEKEEEVGDISVVSSEDMDFYSLSESEYEEDSNQQINNRHQGKEEDDEISMGLGSKSFRYEVNTPAITTRARSACTSFRYVGDEPSLRVTKKIAFVLDDDKMEEKYRETGKKIEANLTQVDKVTPLNSKRFEHEEKDKEEIFGDTNTVGSTSKSPSEWRSSITCRDTGYDPFSSSSRRSCPKWESYTFFQKYDEEMLFLDRISVQKLKETGSFRSSTTHQSSISEKIIHKLSSRNKKTSYVYQNSYHELEAAYVAQICLTWEALNWNYNYFQQLRASRRESDPGCPAYIAQQFQQFQVVLQRYIENEPYQNGRRPIVFARMRSIAPKLLQVPEYRDSDDEKKDEYLGSRISSESFLVIMDESIKTFMNFLRADKENHFHKFTAHFFPIKNPKTSVDPTHILLLKKLNHKKKLKLKYLRRLRKCFRKRKSKQVNEMEVLMAQIDLKIVSRVLRTSDLNEEQLRWCEDKMTKVKVCDMKLQRDSSPLFFSPLFFTLPRH
ncbi:ribosomal protein L34Ae protein [Tanacetum coccineum]|uniref:Ribosomal protein L34Ae protein n=1 Tax=Tanacetum coccineum TaxID=301880 RepID=A0ABQ4ZRM0_9ASTR